jgi:hypothetical protein
MMIYGKYFHIAIDKNENEYYYVQRISTKKLIGGFYEA